MQHPRDVTADKRSRSFNSRSEASAGMGSLAPLLRYIVKALDVPAAAPPTDYSTYTPAEQGPSKSHPPSSSSKSPAQAPSSSTPLAPPSPEQAAALNWAKGLQAEYFAADAEMTALRDVDGHLASARETAAKSDAALKSAKRLLNAAQDKIAEATRLREDQSGFTKRFRKEKYEEEMKTADRLEEEGNAETTQYSREVDFIRHKHGENTKAVADLEVKSRRRKTLDVRRKKILQDLFYGFKAGDLAENVAEDARDKARYARDQRKEALVRSLKALNAITSAVKDLENVLRLLQTSMQSNQMDLMMQGNQGFGGMAGQQTYFNLQKASQLATRANTSLLRAKKLNPAMPLNRTANVKQSAMAIKSFFTDSTFSDMRQRYKIQKQLQSTTIVYREAAVAKKWQERESNQIRMDLRLAEAAYGASEDRLEAERVRLISVPIAA